MDSKEVNEKLDQFFKEEEISSSDTSSENEAVQANIEINKILNGDTISDDGLGLTYINNNTPAIKINKKE